MSESDFQWRVKRGGWHALAKPKPPFGATEIETMRSCIVRLCFTRSDAFPRRVTHAGKVGTAFHRALDRIASDFRNESSAEEFAQRAIDCFDQEILSLEAEMKAHPRERLLPHDYVRRRLARQSIALEAKRLHGRFRSVGIKGPQSSESSGPRDPIEGMSVGEFRSEIKVESKNGVLKGFIDRVELTQAGHLIEDIKITNRDELPEKYERQLQLYAFLLNERSNVWPVEARVLYLLNGHQFPVDVSKKVCKKVAGEAAELVQTLEQGKSKKDLAQPGDACKMCEYRPWCDAFWDHQSAAENDTKLLQQSEIGFEGVLVNSVETDGVIRLSIQSSSKDFSLRFEKQRFPHLQNLANGSTLRVLDVRLSGLRATPTVGISELTEIFIVES